MNITDFLLARIAEDEAEIGAPFGRDEKAGPNGIGWAEVGAIGQVLMSGHVRALAECEAKKAIVEIHQMTEIRREPDQGKALGYWWDAYCLHCTMGGEFTDITKEPREKPCDTLLTLAAIYADHPDYRETWRL